jgi:hypothetical protein
MMTWRISTAPITAASTGTSSTSTTITATGGRTSVGSTS